MSLPLGNYSFLPWLRIGLANQIAAGDGEGGRAVFDVELGIEGAGVDGTVKRVPAGRKVALFGPGDVVGIERRAVVRTEPRDWTTNFEPNYLAAIEFYDEDFPWRYTPAAPDGKGRLQPWLALIVLEEGKFTDGQDMTGKPLPYIEVPDLDGFPDAGELWAWAHVHAGRSLAGSGTEFVSTDMGAVLPRLQALLRENADLALSRIVCPRRLEANRPYHAFLIPSFESGRRAGLGIDPYEHPVPPTTSAWADAANRPFPYCFPYYYRWYFHTGGKGDFESLVRLLQPRPVDDRVGRRDLDVQQPEPTKRVRGVDEGRADLHGILKLGGALRVPDEDLDPGQLAEQETYEKWADGGGGYPQPIQRDLAALVNLADDYAAKAADQANPDGDPDPVITPPLYGMWHARQRRLLTERSGAPVPADRDWVHELNLDPRFRAAAGFGTRVVQEQQETFMNAAWEQIGTVLESNRRIRQGQVAQGATTVWYETHVVPLLAADPQKALQVVAPLNRRILSSGRTIHQRYIEGKIPPVLTSGVFRRITRPRGRLVRKLRFNQDYRLGHLFDRLNDGFILITPPRRIPRPGSRPPEGRMELPSDLLPVPRPEKPPVRAAELEMDIKHSIDPQTTIPRQVMSTVVMPKRVRDEVGPGFVEAMAYPRIDTPMYGPLKDLSSELFLPNLGLIPDNSVTLLKTNQKFIEAYMVGLNHEFARELLWREYPTDQRGSYFRQFWDVGSYFTPETLSDDDLKERLRDIPPLHRWAPASALGQHDHRATGRAGEGEVVLVIRGELLKRYPTAVVYAHRAEWWTKGDGTQARRPVEAEETKPRENVLTPMYDAKVDPDLYFFGFELEVDQARGSANPADARPGWFFVVKERPGEPRFGLDIDKPDRLQVWNDLSWEQVRAGAFLEIGGQDLTLEDPGAGEKKEQHDEDVNVAWSDDMSAAEVAYILFQVPVKVAIHASEMLPAR